MDAIADRGYAHPEVLVSTRWVAERLGDPAVRVVECDEDPLLYPAGHLPGAVEIDWRRDLWHPVRRDYLDRAGFEALAGRLGIARETDVVLYGDRGNQWAAYAFWVFRLFGHRRSMLMDGGRVKWQREGRELTREVPARPATRYRAPERDDREIRVFREGVLAHLGAGRPLVDVRSPEEYSGERLGAPGQPEERALRGGHIPGARNLPWELAIEPADGTFRPAAELRQVYAGEAGLAPGDDVVVYCRIGERSAHTWFALTYLLGYERVRNYDGSWTEWGNLVGAPIERPLPTPAGPLRPSRGRS
jgi:thiosulfate/3-mercaptopyruvate sulfurtransferase